MKITVQTEDSSIVAGTDENSDRIFEAVRTETVNLYNLFHKYLNWVDENYMNVRKIVMHSETYQVMMESDRFKQIRTYTPNDGCRIGNGLQFLGMTIEHEDLGSRGMTDFLIYTDRKVFHSDMVEKDFVEDLDVEGLLRETNDRLEEE